MLLKAHQKLVMIGDSITDVGRGQPVGEGLFEPYGKGYVNLVNALLGAVYPDLAIRVVNVGCSGHTTRELKERWDRDVLNLKPHWVSCMIGTNDVWRQFDMPWQTETHVYPEEYQANLEAMMQATVGKVEGIILLTPFYMEPNRSDAMRAQMDRYGQIVKTVAKKYNTLLVDTQAAFDKALQHYYPATLGWDRVHPSSIGHMVLAKAFVDALGFEWNR